jgi:hypothetical protein
MDRNLLGSLVGGLLGLSSLGALGFAMEVRRRRTGATDGGWRLLEPVTYENLAFFR